ncbi:MAG: YifB family Mg chelatase-like AAA ATPase [Candidatus Levybacteria bacterium]|nr:YifB family Mg chelatase-like AAA ATPase [Candidatus Levybacteria bacterium]
MLAKVYSAAVVGLDAIPIEVEVDIASQGLPNFTIVGLPDKAVEEAKERVRSAIKNSGADFPARRITVNLAPADLPKEGPSYDLPIAIGILLASGQINADVSNLLFSGELALDGRLRPVLGILPQVLLAQLQGWQGFFVPEENAREAAIIDSVHIYPTPTLLSLFHHLTKQKIIEPQVPTIFENESSQFEFDMKDIKGQHLAKRALEIAAAGGHNVLMKGPPGAGKTLLARTLPSILPNLTFSEAIDVTKIYSIAGNAIQKGLAKTRPFRSPHHSTSLVGLIGGGTTPKPGEITLAHRGILFLDELPEFPRNVLETLRQPIEDGIVHISRANNKISFPAKCMLIAAQNPCPCGYFGDPTKECSCAPSLISRYQKKVSGPILDRIDIHLSVPAVKTEKLTEATDDNESSTDIQKRVQAARDIQTTRFQNTPLKSNADLGTKSLKEYAPLSEDVATLLKKAVVALNLSGRGYHRTLKVARTIADLAGSAEIKTEHVAEALQYRPAKQ